jgi:hypothetical protein
MPAIRAQVILKTTSAIPADYVTNTFCFDGADTLGRSVELTAAIKAFYDDVRTDVGYPGIAGPGHEIKFYELPGLVPNYPYDTTTWAFSSAPTGQAYASEVALCLSFQGEKVPGFPQNRRRGRIYLGPCSDSIHLTGRPNSTNVSAIAAAGGAFKTAVAAITGDVVWAIWSGANGDAVPVLDGWCDNAWDTQRRRGLIPTSRTTFS